MSLLEKIETDLINSIKSTDLATADVLRMAKAALMNAKIAKPDHILSESEEIEVLRKENRKRAQSIEMFKQGNRLDLVEKEQSQLIIMQKYLPTELSDEEIETIVKSAISQTGASTMADMGKIMSIVTLQLKGKADGSRVAQIVKNQMTV